MDQSVTDSDPPNVVVGDAVAAFVEPLFWEVAPPDTVGESQYQAILFNGTGFWLTPLMSKTRARTIAAAAQDAVRLEELLTGGRGTRIELADVARIEFASERQTMFIVHGDDRTRIAFSTAEDTSTIGRSLGSVVFPGRPVSEEAAGTTKAFRKIAHPIPKALAFAVVAVVFNTVVRPDQESYGNDTLRRAVDDVFAAVPAAAVYLVAFVVLVASGLYHQRTTAEPVIHPFTLSIIEPDPEPANH